MFKDVLNAFRKKTFNPFKQMRQGSVNALHNARLAYIKACLFVTLSLVVEPTRPNYTTTASLANRLCIMIILVYTPLYKSMVFFHQCHPRIITENFDPNCKYFGLIRC